MNQFKQVCLGCVGVAALLLMALIWTEADITGKAFLSVIVLGVGSLIAALIVGPEKPVTKPDEVAK